MKRKIHKIDLLFLCGIVAIGILGGAIDGFMWFPIDDLTGSFPVFSLLTVYVSYMFWLFLLIYSHLKYREKEARPKFVKWFMFFILAYIHIFFACIGWGISYFIVSIF